MGDEAKRRKLLQEIAAIERMERGVVYRQRRYTGYEFFTHDIREGGKTVTRYVRKAQVDLLRKHIKAHRDFRRLVKRYENLIIKETRAERRRAQRAAKRGELSAGQRITVGTRRVKNTQE